MNQEQDFESKVVDKYNRKSGVGLMTSSEKVYQAFAILIVGLLCLACIIPIYYVLVISFSSKTDLAVNNGFVLFPLNFQLYAYQMFFRTATIFSTFRVSILRVIVAVSLQLSICSIAAYSLSQPTLPGRKVFITILIVSLLVGPSMIPAYLWALQNGTANTFWIYVLPQAYSAFGIILFRQFFMDIPASLVESARIDGISESKLMLYIVLPLSKPIFATIALFCAVGNWNDYVTNMIYVRDQELMTIAFYLQQTLVGVIDFSSGSAYSGTSDMFSNVANAAPNESYKMAAVVISTTPIILVYPFLQKYFATGMLSGAIKG